MKVGTTTSVGAAGSAADVGGVWPWIEKAVVSIGRLVSLYPSPRPPPEMKAMATRVPKGFVFVTLQITLQLALEDKIEMKPMLFPAMQRLETMQEFVRTKYFPNHRRVELIRVKDKCNCFAHAQDVAWAEVLAVPHDKIVCV